MPKKYSKWTDYEDNVLIELVQKEGDKNWTLLANLMKPYFEISKKNGKQCRERWFNHLEKSIKNEKWSKQEDLKLTRLQALLGTKWIEIAKQFDGRSSNNVKNRFFSIVRKSLRVMCRYASVKSKDMKVYQIKPNTLSKLFMIGEGSAQMRLSHGGPEVCSTSGIFSKNQYHEITQIIKESTQIEMPSKEKTIQALERILLINSQFQSEHFLEYSSEPNLSSGIISLEEYEKLDLDGQENAISRESNRISIQQQTRIIATQSNIQEQSENGIFSRRIKADRKPLNQIFRLQQLSKSMPELRKSSDQQKMRVDCFQQYIYNINLNEQDNFVDKLLSKTPKYQMRLFETPKFLENNLYNQMLE